MVIRVDHKSTSLPVAFRLIAHFRASSVDNSPISEAAEIKSDYPIAYADAFCVATAKRLNGRILTSNPEFKAVEKLVSVQWIAVKRNQ